jgi:hypothetical protein
VARPVDTETETFEQLLYRLFRPEVAQDAVRRYRALMAYYDGRDRPQYEGLVRLAVEAEARLAQAMLEAQERGVSHFDLMKDKALAQGVRAAERTVRDNLAQLQRHTESVRVDLQQYNAEARLYVQVVAAVIAEHVRDQELVEKIHARLSEELANLGGELGPPAG